MSRPGHLGARASPAGVRRLHGPAHSRSGAGRREAAPDDHRSAVRGRVRARPGATGWPGPPPNAPGRCAGQIVWAKDALVLGRGHYHWTHEPCWYGVRAGGNGHWHGDRSQTTLWEISGRKQDATKQTTLWPIAGRGQDAETALAGKRSRWKCMPYLLHNCRLDLGRRGPAHDALVTGRDVFLQHPLRHVIAVSRPRRRQWVGDSACRPCRRSVPSQRRATGTGSGLRGREGYLRQDGRALRPVPRVAGAAVSLSALRG